MYVRNTNQGIYRALYHPGKFNNLYYSKAKAPAQDTAAELARKYRLSLGHPRQMPGLRRGTPSQIAVSSQLVILNAAKNLVSCPTKTRLFAALRVTRGGGPPGTGY